MSGESVTRRGFLRTSAAVVGGGALVPRGLWALGQDAAVEVPRSNNHIGYEKVAYKARPFPMAHVRLRPGPLKDMQERNRVYLYMLPNDRLLHSFRLTAGKTSKA
ncbi:MAG TPA: twin-arginine translocation signal domain-containing protein, partial [Blastocatellia bacterium]|nr:twin-arginine translocation signal domain-containing protein [Blastocatellia bacterium]